MRSMPRQGHPLLALALLIFGFSNLDQAFADDGKPKYGPEATPLSLSHQYFRKHAAEGFWSLIPYYIPQQTHSSCSVATVSMVLNAARAGTPLKADQGLVTESELLKKVNQGAWKKSIGSMGRGTSLDELKPLVEASFKEGNEHSG